MPTDSIMRIFQLWYNSMSESAKYSLGTRIMHWITGIPLIMMLIGGFYMTSLSSSSEKWEYYGIHKAIGVTLLVMVIIRLVITISSAGPATPSGMSATEILLSRWTHFLLRITMLLMPLSGYLMSCAGGNNVVWFFDIPVFSLISINTGLAKCCHYIHVNCAYALSALIIIHVLATIKHILFNKFNILRRMV